MPVGCEYRLVNDVTVLQRRHAFSGNSKQLQRHDSVHLSSFYTYYRFLFVYVTHCLLSCYFCSILGLQGEQEMINT